MMRLHATVELQPNRADPVFYTDHCGQSAAIGWRRSWWRCDAELRDEDPDAALFERAGIIKPTRIVQMTDALKRARRLWRQRMLPHAMPEKKEYELLRRREQERIAHAAIEHRQRRLQASRSRTEARKEATLPQPYRVPETNVRSRSMPVDCSTLTCWQMVPRRRLVEMMGRGVTIGNLVRACVVSVGPPPQYMRVYQHAGFAEGPWYPLLWEGLGVIDPSLGTCHDAR